MDINQMVETIRTIKPRDKFEIVFAEKTFNGDLKGRLYMILTMSGHSIAFGQIAMLMLKAVADSGKWDGFFTYTITALAGFDAEYFISRTIGREMLTSVRRI